MHVQNASIELVLPGAHGLRRRSKSLEEVTIGSQAFGTQINSKQSMQVIKVCQAIVVMEINYKARRYYSLRSLTCDVCVFNNGIGVSLIMHTVKLQFQCVNLNKKLKSCGNTSAKWCMKWVNGRLSCHMATWLPMPASIFKECGLSDRW